MFKAFTPFTHTRGAMRERPAFAACAPSQAYSIGFVSHSNGNAQDAGVELVMIEAKTVPADLVKREANKRADSIERETGRRPKGKHFKEIKEEVAHELLAKAFPKRKTVPLLWLDEHLLIGSTSAGDVDAITSLLVESERDLVVTGLGAPSPATAMTRWAREPAAATTPWAVGRDLAVLFPDGGRATFKDVSITCSDVREAIAGDNVVTALALSNDREVSFTLTADLQVKSLKLAGTTKDEGHADAVTAEAHLYRGELQHLLGQLLEALRAA